ncbi:hypothetical protein PHMEG_00017916 [Phytophthora megakarya]|uniref:Uncharacterized protein n=1 Tax=Phytophthora megakarya TaxID=4795 RepID=A0A225VWM8_9STRA|nr:hypothetical protein PHMEG_00017916 [Phytophthora megakarya]
MDHFLAVIHELIETNRTLVARLTIVEATQMKSNKHQAYTEAKETYSPLEQELKSKRGKKQATNLSATWYESYTSVTRVWIATDRQKKSESHHIAAFRNLFLTDGFVLDDKAADYKDQVLHASRRVEDAQQQSEGQVHCIRTSSLTDISLQSDASKPRTCRNTRHTSHISLPYLLRLRLQTTKNV